MKRLPEGWAWATLGEVSGDMRNGLSPKPNADSGLPVLRISAVRSMSVDLTDRRFFDPPPAGWERYKLQTDDLLFTRYSGTPAFVGVCGVVCSVDESVVYPDKLIRVRVREGVVVPAFLEKSLAEGQARAEIKKRLKTTSGQVGISGGDLKEIAVSVAPLNEQRRIVAKIDALMAKSRRAKEALDAIPPLLDKLRQSILAAAFRGDLTADWRAAHPNVEPASKLLDRIRTERRRRWEEAELANLKAKGKLPADHRWKAKYQEPEPVDESGLPELPEGWAYGRLPSILSAERVGMKTGPFGTLLQKSDHQPSGVPVIGIENIGPMRFLERSRVFLAPEKAAALRDYDVQPGDLVISRTGTVGEVCVVPGGIGEAVLSTNTIRVSLHSELVPDIVGYAFSGDPFVLAQVHALCSGSTRDFLNQSIMGELILRIPPLEEQRMLADKLHSARTGLAGIEERAAHLRDQFALLDSSVLAMAFRGELVPQDPNDEPASALLERLRAESSAQPKQSSRGRKAKTA